MVDTILKRALTASAFAAAVAVGVPAMADTSSLTSAQFAPGWEQHTTALINRGPGPNASATTIWYVPGNVPKGLYVVINREADGARLIDGYAVTITSDPQRQIHVVLPQYYGVVELLPSSDVPGFKDVNTKVRFEGP
jgi:hypothetical protein